jgi:hypothetical protein
MPASRSVAVLSEKLGLEELAQELVDVHPLPGRRVATLVHAMVAGASFIDDADVLRSGPTAEVLGHRVMAPSTLGTFLLRGTSVSSTSSPKHCSPGRGPRPFATVRSRGLAATW